MIDTYAIGWPLKPRPRPRAVWAHLTRGHHATFKASPAGRRRAAERRFAINVTKREGDRA